MRQPTKRQLWIFFIGITIASTYLEVYPQSQKESSYPPVSSAIMDADLRSFDGVTFTLSDHKGKVLFVYLWAIWCGPNRPQLPRIVALQQKYRDAGFEVIGLNVGAIDGKQEPIKNIRKFKAKFDLNFILVRSSPGLTNRIYALAQMAGIPIGVLIDRLGHLRAVIRGGGSAVDRDTDNAVQKVMSEKVGQVVRSSAP